MSNSWSNFAVYFNLSHSYGSLIDPNYSISTFDYQILRKKLQQYHRMTEEQVLEDIKNFPPLSISDCSEYKDAIIVHDYLVAILLRFLLIYRKLNITEENIKIHQNLAKPLYLSSNKLGIKYGMGASIGFLWEPINYNYLKGDYSFGIEDFKIRFHFTQREDQELLFFGGSIVAAFYLARVNKMAFEINEIIEEEPLKIQIIEDKFAHCINCWQKIILENQKVHQKLDAHFFFHQLRPFLRPFQQIIFEKVDNGLDILASSSGGSGGNDSSFQIFQRNFGIKYKEAYNKTQVMLRSGMIKQHKELIQYLQEKSQIRNFCSSHPTLVTKYNELLLSYSNFLELHSEFIKKFIFGNMNDHSFSTAKGTAETTISDLIERHQVVRNQFLA